MSFDKIPVVDLSYATSPDPKLRNAVVEDVRNACLQAGFFYVENHGVSEEAMKGVHSAAQSFFALSLEDKMKARYKTDAKFKGYTPIRSANNDPNGDGDFHEGFMIGYEPLLSNSSDEQGKLCSEVLFGSNVWPTQLDNFRQQVLTYYHEAVRVGKILFPLFASALNLPADFFDDKTRNSAAIMRLLFYPPQSGPVDDRIIGIGAHTDWECFTILWQEPDIQALQVLNPETKKWINAPPKPGTLVVNLGDQFMRWTNDIFKSNVHRAINRTGIKRYSIPLFFGTDYDVLLEPIPGCVSEDRPAKYKPITAGEYIQSRLQATYS